MNVAFVFTSKYFYIGYVSLYSFLKSNKKNKINLYIVHDENLPQKKIDELKFFEKFKNIQSFNFIKINSSKYTKFNSTCNTLYCFELAELINVDKMLFLHNVNLITQDLKELYDTNIENNSCATTEYICPSRLVKTNEQRKFILSNKTLLFNFEYLRKHHYFERLMSEDFMKKLTEVPIINDLIILNFLIENAKQFTINYGYEEIWFKDIEIQGCDETKKLYNQYHLHIKAPAIVCFINRNPLSKKCKHSYLNLWWKYAQETPIYDKIKYFKPRSFIEYLFSKKDRIRMIKEFQSQPSHKKIQFIIKFVTPYLLQTIVALGLAIPIGCLDAVIALSLKPYMDVVMIEKNTQPSWYIPLLIIAFTSLQGILNYASTYCNDWTIGKVSQDVKKALYNKLMRKGSSFFDTKTSGEIQKKFNNDADRVCTGIFGGTKLIISRVFSSISLIGVLIYNSWQLAIVAIFILLCAIFPLTKMRDCIKSATSKSERASSLVITDYNELFSGSKVVQAFNLYYLLNEIFSKHLNSIFKLKMQISKTTGIISPIMHIISSIGIGVTIGFGSYLVTTNKITSGNFVSFITALIMLYTPIKGLGSSMKSIQTSLLALERVINQLDAQDFIIDRPNTKLLNNLTDCIEFENVCFAYKRNKPVLKNINFKIPKGETFALVGNSGGGKSTIVNLIPRFYDLPKTSSIKIDGIDIKNYKVDSLRNNIAIVLQDNFLFAGTIRENILMGKLDATEEELQHAVKNACLDEFIDSLEQGLDTFIGEKGVLLSGGQKQRIAIARAFIKNAPIVILDEATSALDNQSEAIVQAAIDNLMKDKTVFVIAHRLSTIQNADRIAVINEGKLVELGNHEELMQIENGEYKKLYEMQFKKAEV